MKRIDRAMRTVAVMAFILGVILIAIGHISVRSYTNAHTDNYLAPAGQFIPGPETFRFAVLGDSALRNAPLETVLRDILESNFAFMVNVGDQARRPTTAHFEWLLQELRQEVGDFPYYAVPGNHDITKNPDERRLRFYKRAFGQPDYWFSYGDALFICLDTSTGEFPDDKAAWLESTLSRLREQFNSCLLLMHIPPTDPRPGKHYCLRQGVDRLEGIVRAHNVTAILAGHIHEFVEGDFGGVPVYITPPSGQTMRGKTDSYGYLAIFVDAEGTVSVRPVPVTQEQGREYIEYYLSTEVQRYPVVEIGLVLVLSGFVLALFSARFAIRGRCSDGVQRTMETIEHCTAQDGKTSGASSPPLS